MESNQLVKFSVGFYEESVEDKILLTYIEMLVGDNKAEKGNLLKNMALNYLKTQKPNTFNELKEILGNKVEEKKEKFSLTIEDEESKKRLESLMLVENSIPNKIKMRDPSRIKNILTEIEEIWEEYSDWRFGQLLCNICYYEGKDIFYIEDEVLEDKLKEAKQRFLIEKKEHIIEEKTLNIGIDIGFAYLASFWNGGKLTIPSLCKEISKKEALETSKVIAEKNIKNGRQLVVKFRDVDKKEEKYFYVGDIALEKDDKVRRVLTTKTLDNLKYLVKVLSLLGITTDEEDINFNLSIGIPVKMKGKAQELKEWLTGRFEISFLCRGKEIIRKINIENVEVLSQALAPVYSLEEYRGKQIVSVDLGHYTNDMCFWTGGSKRDDLDYCGDGFHQCYNEMRNMLLNDKNIIELTTTIREKDIQEALENGVVNLINGKNDVEYNREKILKDYSIMVVEDIVTMYETIFDDIDFILISGGLIENNSFINMFMKEIEKYRMKILMPEEPKYAVAKGLYNLVCKKYNN